MVPNGLISNRLKYRPVSLNITYTDMSKIEAVWIELVEHNVLQLTHF